MIDALERALAEIHTVIPPQVLDIAFRTYDYMDVSVDERIRSEVINKKVRKDVSVYAGPLYEFILDSAWGRYTNIPSVYSLGVNGSYSTFVIPPEAREHRDISCVIDVKFPYTIANGSVTNYYTNNNNGGNTLSGLACSALRAQTGANMISNPIGKVAAGNVIVLSPQQMSFVPWRVRVRLEFDPNFTGMEVSAIEPFCELCKLATQAYIYTNTIVDIESNVVFRGASVGVIKDIISGYSDAAEKYHETMLNFRGGAAYDTDRLYAVLQKCVPK